jgi:transcription antitermination factor NusG
MSMRIQPWPWFAILIRNHSEKSAALLLENAGYECFFPVSNNMSHSSGQLEKFEVPLFPGCLFCRMDPTYRLPVLRTPGVIQIVGADEDLIPADEGEIAALQRVGKAGVSTMPWPYMQVGTLARLADGPLRGLSGFMIKIKSGLKLILSVSLLHRSVAVEVESSWLSCANPPRNAEFQMSHSRATLFRSR